MQIFRIWAFASRKWTILLVFSLFQTTTYLLQINILLQKKLENRTFIVHNKRFCFIFCRSFINANEVHVETVI